jgi:hypothetical protein
MREIRTSSSMRGRRKRTTASRACALLYRSPQKNVAPLLSTGFADSAPTQISLFRRIHVSAFNFCMSLFRLEGVAINMFSLSGLVSCPRSK